MDPVNADHANSSQCGSKGFQIVSILLDPGDILRKCAHKCLVSRHWAEANHLTMLDQSGLHNNVRFISPLGNDTMAKLTIGASAASRWVMRLDLIRLFHELHGTALVSVLSAWFCATGFALALGSRFGITVTGWRGGAVSAILLVVLRFQLFEKFVNPGSQYSNLNCLTLILLRQHLN